MKTILFCLAAISMACMLSVVFFGPTAKHQGAERAIALIEAATCGNDDGVVAQGWEEHCLK